MPKDTETANMSIPLQEIMEWNPYEHPPRESQAKVRILQGSIEELFSISSDGLFDEIALKDAISIFKTQLHNVSTSKDKLAMRVIADLLQNLRTKILDAWQKSEREQQP